MGRIMNEENPLKGVSDFFFTSELWFQRIEWFFRQFSRFSYSELDEVPNESVGIYLNEKVYPKMDNFPDGEKYKVVVFETNQPFLVVFFGADKDPCAKIYESSQECLLIGFSCFCVMTFFEGSLIMKRCNFEGIQLSDDTGYSLTPFGDCEWHYEFASVASLD
jgi:hypothetical protein